MKRISKEERIVPASLLSKPEMRLKQRASHRWTLYPVLFFMLFLLYSLSSSAKEETLRTEQDVCSRAEFIGALYEREESRGKENGAVSRAERIGALHVGEESRVTENEETGKVTKLSEENNGKESGEAGKVTKLSEENNGKESEEAGDVSAVAEEKIAEISEDLEKLNMLLQKNADALRNAPGCSEKKSMRLLAAGKSVDAKWTETPYENEYLMMKTHDTGLTFQKGYPYKELTDSFAEMFELLSVLTGGMTEDPEVWGNAWKFAERMLKKKKVTSLSEVPKWFPEGGEKTWPYLWEELSAAALRGDSEGVKTMLKTFAKEPYLYFYEENSVSAKQWYVMYVYDANTPLINGFRTSDGTEGYCLQWNQAFPDGLSVTDAESSEELRMLLGIDEEAFEKLLSILHRGYPLNAGLSDTPFGSYPEEALKEGTQAAIWAFLASVGAVGNDGVGNGGAGIVTLSGIRNLTDPLLNADGSTYDVLKYVRYLMEGASSETSVPVIEIKEMTDFFIDEDGNFRSEIKISGAYCEYGIHFTVAGVSGEMRVLTEEGTVLSAGEDGSYLLPEDFNGNSVNVLPLSIVFSPENNGRREVTVSVNAESGIDPSDTGLLFSVHADRQIMAKLSMVEKKIAVSEEITKETPTAELQVWKKDSDGRLLSGAFLELRTPEGTVISSGETVDGGILFTGLQPGGTYVLFETMAPETYRISDELQNGTEIVMPVSELLFEMEIINERIPEEETEEPPAAEPPEEPVNPTEEPVIPSEKPFPGPEEKSTPVVLGITGKGNLPIVLSVLSVLFLFAALLLGRGPQGPGGGDPAEFKEAAPET